MFNETERTALARACAYLNGRGRRVDLDMLAAALDQAGICGLTVPPLPVYVRVTVELAMTKTPEAALAWAGEHSVFDMLDKGASVSSATVHDENGELIAGNGE